MYGRNNYGNSKQRRMESAGKSMKCEHDLGYNPLQEEIDDDWRGVDCDNITKKITDKNCIYPDKYPINFSGYTKDDFIDQQLECAHSKWKWIDPDKKTNPEKTKMEKYRKAYMFSTMAEICKNNKILCSEKDIDGQPKDKDERCVEAEACPDEWPSLTKFFSDVEEFYKLLMKIMDFSSAKMEISSEDVSSEERKERKERSKELSKEMKELVKQYKILQPGNPANVTECSKVSKSKNLKKDIGLYESEYSSKTTECFDDSQKDIIKQYKNKRDEQAKIDPTMSRRLKRAGRTIKQGVGKAGKSITDFGKDTALTANRQTGWLDNKNQPTSGGGKRKKSNKKKFTNTKRSRKHTY